MKAPIKYSLPKKRPGRAENGKLLVYKNKLKAEEFDLEGIKEKFSRQVKTYLKREWTYSTRVQN